MSEKPGAGKGPNLVFGFFNEVGILAQLSQALLAKILPEGVHPSHFGIVAHLSRLENGQTPVRIAAAMQVTKNTMTHSLKVLEKHGFVTVMPNPEDARGKVVFATDAGRAFVQEAQVRIAERFGGLFDDEHCAAMGRMMEDLTRLRKHLDENR